MRRSYASSTSAVRPVSWSANWRLCLSRVRPVPGPLAVERQRELRLFCEVEGEVVRAVGADARAGREHALGWLTERDRDDAGRLRHALSRAQVEGDAGPAPVVDLAAERDEGLVVGVRGHAGLPEVAVVLPAHDLRRARSAGANGRPCSSPRRSVRGASSVGGSIAMNASTWNRWFTTMSRYAPVCS